MLYVGADDRAGARTAVRHLLASGRRRVATVTGPLDTPAGADRLDSYRLELGDLAAPELVASSPEWSRRAGRRRWPVCWSRRRTWTRCSSPPT
jgi:DNA-binding LacI/PurR family transcriptional regulator